LIERLKASSAFFGSAAITFVLGEKYFAASAVPLSKPPPPTGAKIMSRELFSLNNSLAAVA